MHEVIYYEVESWSIEDGWMQFRASKGDPEAPAYGYSLNMDKIAEWSNTNEEDLVVQFIEGEEGEGGEAN